MGKELNRAETARWLSERDEFLIITHRRPDGDALGCAAALAQTLRETGKKAFILYNKETTGRYLRYVENYWADEDFEPRYIITVDTASYELFPENGMKYEGAVSLCIDHHPSNTDYAEHNCIDGKCASCGELVYDILISLSGSIGKITAECLYVALSTDTGCFAFANTTADTLRIAALTVEAGAPQREINRRLFRTKTRGRVVLEGMINSGLEFYYDGQAAIATITREHMSITGSGEDDVDDIASIPGSIEGVYVGITVRELTGPGDCKVSVRTSPLVNANDLCVKFGGGGHAMAAGFSMKAEAAEIKRMLVDALGEVLPVKRS